MILKYFYDANLAQASYLVGCAETGEAIVIDPARDITPYLRVAEAEDLRIVYVTETHIHADYVSGSRELAARTGARIYLSDMGDDNWKYAYAGDPNVILLHDGDRWMIGNIRLQVLHTPGHTPEHISFLLTDTAASEQPMGIFTGDFVFAGDVGRPDLLEAAAGMAGTKEVGARQQFASLQQIKSLPDYLQIWPGHGAGSACGKALGAVPSTTLGYEKLTNPAFQFEDENEFVDWLLADQPEAPRYFAQMKRVNKRGPALVRDLEQPALQTSTVLDDLLKQDAQLFDLRSASAYRERFIPGTLNVPATETSFTTYVGWFVDYERPLYLIFPAAHQETAEALLPDILAALRAIGVDDIGGYFTSAVVEAVGNENDYDSSAAALAAVSAHDVAGRYASNGIVILDVRGKSEFKQAHITGVRHIPLGYLPQELDRLPRDRPVFVHCATGYRSQIAASLLRAHGFDKVAPIDDSFEELSRQLPTESGANGA